MLKIFEDWGVEGEHQVVVGCLGVLDRVEGTFAGLLDDVSNWILFGSTE